MKKDVIKSLTFTAVILALTVVTARCALVGDEVSAAEPTRIEAPAVTYENNINVRREHVTGGASPSPAVDTEIPSVSAAAPETGVVDPYELMYDLPLRAEVQLAIAEMCRARDVDARVVLGIIEVENSTFDESAVGDACNSFGLMQVRPDSHSDRMARLGVTDLLDGVQNVLVGIDYLDELLDRYGGDYYKAVTAYNKGHYPGYVTPYAYKVMAIAEEVR